MYPMVDCLQCGFCMTGCPFGRKQHLGKNYIPQAEEVGAEFRTGCQVQTVEAKAGNYVVHYLDPNNIERQVETPLLLMAAGALETPAILLRSKETVPDLHPEVGRNLNNNVPWETPAWKVSVGPVLRSTAMTAMHVPTMIVWPGKAAPTPTMLLLAMTATYALSGILAPADNALVVAIHSFAMITAFAPMILVMLQLVASSLPMRPIAPMATPVPSGTTVKRRPAFQRDS